MRTGGRANISIETTRDTIDSDACWLREMTKDPLVIVGAGVKTRHAALYYQDAIDQMRAALALILQAKALLEEVEDERMIATLWSAVEDGLI